MDTAERRKREKQILTAAAISLAVFAAGLIWLPALSEKILLGVVLVLIMGTLFFNNDTGRYYQYFVEHKKSEPEIYVIRDGKKITYAEIKKEIEIQ